MSDEVKRLLNDSSTDSTLRSALEHARSTGATPVERQKLTAALIAATGNPRIDAGALQSSVKESKSRGPSRLRSVVRITRTTLGLAAAIFVVVMILRHLPTAEERTEDAAVSVQRNHGTPSSGETAGLVKMPTEAELLARARATLSGAPAQAFEILETHRRDHPHGEFAEERDAMRIHALVAIGRRADAQMNGELFLRQYPRSSYAAGVRRVLAR